MFLKVLRLPCVFSLLPDKSQTTYDMMLAAVADKVGIDGHPVVAMCDFERATINTLSAIFPHAKISGCMFHLRKAIWTHVQDCGLQSLFHRNTLTSPSTRYLLCPMCIHLTLVSSLRNKYW